MKIQINYDLMEKISLYNNGFSVRKVLSKSFTWGLFWFGVHIIENIVQKDHTIKWGDNITTFALFIPMFSMVDFSLSRIPLFKESTIEDAYEDLKKTSTALQLIGVKTNPTLLKDSETLKHGFKIIKNNKNIPVIQEYKYIEVPTRSDYGYESTDILLQEHNMFSKNYDLSVGDYEKEKEYKLVKNGI